MKKKNTNRMFRSRKAVSPLIATVLLIAFAVALGAVVMNWGRGYVEDTANIARERSDTEVTCASDVDISIVKIDGVPQVCYNASFSLDNTSVDFIIENKKGKTVEKIQARLIASATRVPYTVDLGDISNLTTNAAKLLNFTYDTDTYGTPTQIQLTPYIKVGGTEVACPSSAEISTDIKACSEVWD
ncbi:hypothetical protein KY349_00080 [Candidatus Woesearchaeota archaeon]|jgi:flagellin-like protein|nr:hypothetical protein [Candidatus Woesearchaeota archaeon]